MLKDTTFFEKDHEDVYKHIDELLEIADYFNYPNIIRDEVML